MQLRMQLWKLYNTTSMDFHLFFCSHNTEQLHGRLTESEHSLFKPLWQVMDSSNLSGCLIMNLSFLECYLAYAP